MHRGATRGTRWGGRRVAEDIRAGRALHGLRLVPDVGPGGLFQTHGGAVIDADAERVLRQITGVVHDRSLLPTPNQAVAFGLGHGIVPTWPRARRAVGGGGSAGSGLLAILRAQLPILGPEIECV